MYKAVVIGASAGALEALSIILPMLPAEFPLACIVIVHLPPDKDSILPQLLQSKCRISVREATDKEPIEPGTAYLAPPDYHLLIEPNFHLSLSSEEQVNFSRPSIDVLFEAAADEYGSEVIGVILTGANNDGARGLEAIAKAGGLAVVQQPETAYSAAMPAAALQACPQAIVESLAGIGQLLLNLSDRS
jgi:two-component system chemotaxis response regulator CheB